MEIKIYWNLVIINIYNLNINHHYVFIIIIIIIIIISFDITHKIGQVPNLQH